MAERVLRLRPVRRGLTIDLPDTTLQTLRLPAGKRLCVVRIRTIDGRAELPGLDRLADIGVDGVVVVNWDTEIEVLEEIPG